MMFFPKFIIVNLILLRYIHKTWDIPPLLHPFQFVGSYGLEGGRREFELTISTIYTNENSWNLCFLTLLVIITMLCHYIIFLILFIFKKCSIMLIFHHEIVLTQLVTLLRGIVHQFWINSIKGTFFYDRSISIKLLWLEIEKNGAQSQSVLCT